MKVLLLIASLCLVSVYGFRVMTRLDGFLSDRKRIPGRPSRRRIRKGTRMEKSAFALLHSILDHLCA